MKLTEKEREEIKKLVIEQLNNKIFGVFDIHMITKNETQEFINDALRDTIKLTITETLKKLEKKNDR